MEMCDKQDEDNAEKEKKEEKKSEKKTQPTVPFARPRQWPDGYLQAVVAEGSCACGGSCPAACGSPVLQEPVRLSSSEELWRQ